MAHMTTYNKLQQKDRIRVQPFHREFLSMMIQRALKTAKRKPALRMKTESMKNEDCKFKVLFVCTGNAYRSPICEALLKKIRPDLEVDSAGTKITGKITKEAREYLMSEDAIQYLKKTPESIDSKQVEQYDIIIAMEQRHKDSVLKKCPECKNKVVVWDVRDKIPFLHRRTEKINNQMKKNVTEYAGSLA
jgi:protein-tyrosine-phosphatase